MFEINKTYGICDVCKKPGFDLVVLGEKFEQGYRIITKVGHKACYGEGDLNVFFPTTRSLEDVAQALAEGDHVYGHEATLAGYALIMWPDPMTWNSSG